MWESLKEGFLKGWADAGGCGGLVHSAIFWGIISATFGFGYFVAVITYLNM
jgi:hypothetical protein